MVLLPLARAARRSRLTFRSASAADGARPDRIASLAVLLERVTLRTPEVEGLVVDLVGVEAAQLVGEALGVAAVGQGDRAVGLARLRQRGRVAVLGADEVDRAARALEPHGDDPGAVAGAGQRDGAAQARREPAGEQLPEGESAAATTVAAVTCS